MSYTDKISYIKCKALYEGNPVSFSVKENSCFTCTSSDSSVYTRATEIFSQDQYAFSSIPPLFLGKYDIDFPEEEIYALRYLIKQPGSDFVIPQALSFLKEIIQSCASYQRKFFPDFDGRFVYITIRSGIVKSTNEDSFHVDGFQGLSVPRHIPEQNYIWADSYPTIFSLQSHFVEHLDPQRHNFHDYFNRHTRANTLVPALEKSVYIIDPYHIHARPYIPPNTMRSFLRICFSPVEIRDDTNMINKWLPRGPYNRDDIRNSLISYDEDALIQNVINTAYKI